MRIRYAATTWLVCVTLGVVLAPAVSYAKNPRAGSALIKPFAILGVTPPKVMETPPMSVRDANFPRVRARNANGDTYDAAGLVQDAATAFFFDDLPNNHVFGTGEESAGVNLFSNVDTRIIGVDMGPGAPGTNRLQVNYFTVDGSDLVPTGVVSPDMLIFDAWRLDVGSTAFLPAVPDKISWTPLSTFTVVDSGICLFRDGVGLGCFALVSDESDASGVAGIGIVGLMGDDIAGFGLDEMSMFWVIQTDPTCGDGVVDAGEECDAGGVPSGICSPTCKLFCDTDGDGDFDLLDFSRVQPNFTGPVAP